MARNPANARPRSVVIDDDTTDEPTSPTTAVHGAHPRSRRERDVAKHAPGRISSRLYARVRSLNDTLENLQAAAAGLQDLDRDLVTAKLARTQVALAGARENVERAMHDRVAGDRLKDQLAEVSSTLVAIEVTIRALAVARRTQAGKDQSHPLAILLAARIDDVHAAVPEDASSHALVSAHTLLKTAGAQAA